MRSLMFLLVAVSLSACSGDSSSPVSPTPQPPTTTTISQDPRLISSEVQINRSSANYHYVGWKFTIESPRAYDYSYVEIRWYDANDFQVEWSNWVGALRQGTHTYSDETIVNKETWARVVRREVELRSWR